MPPLKIIKNGSILFGLTILVVSFQSCDSSFNSTHSTSTNNSAGGINRDSESLENRDENFSDEGSGYQLENSPSYIYKNNFFRDSTFNSGIQHGWANTLPASTSQDCRNRWNTLLPNLSSSSWLFWEIAENTYFCENTQTPTQNNGQLIYSSADQSKQFNIISPGHFKMSYDTRKEWRKGCNLSLPDGPQNQPRFGDRDTNWPHFLIGQHIEDSSNSRRELALGKYNLRWKSSVKLNLSTRLGAPECEEGVWADGKVPNHELFYMAAVLRHKNFPQKVGNNINANQIYALIPMFYSEDAIQHKNPAPWINADQYGNVVYFAPGYSSLSLNKWVNFDIDVEGLAIDSLKLLKSTYGENLSIEDYHVNMVLIGWEIWGGYQNQVEVKNLALVPAAEQPQPQPQIVYGEVVGGIDGIVVENGRQFVWGWACSQGAPLSINLHIYAGGPHPMGTLISQARTLFPGEEGVSKACSLPLYKPIRYKVEIPNSAQYKNQPVYIYGIHPSGDPSLVRLLGGSGYEHIR